MRRVLIIMVPVVIVAALLTGLMLRGDADVRAIRKAFHALVEDVELAEREDLLRAGLSARRIAARCTDDVTVSLQGLPVTIGNRAELKMAALHARGRLDYLSVDVADVQIEIGDDRQGATLIAGLRISASGAGDRGRELRAVQIDWRPTEEGWKVRRVRSFETIRSPETNP